MLARDILAFREAQNPTLADGCIMAASAIQMA